MWYIYEGRGELPSNTVVTTVMSNIGLYKAFDAKGIRTERQQSVTSMFVKI